MTKLNNNTINQLTFITEAEMEGNTKFAETVSKHVDIDFGGIDSSVTRFNTIKAEGLAKVVAYTKEEMAKALRLNKTIAEEETVKAYEEANNVSADDSERLLTDEELESLKLNDSNIRKALMALPNKAVRKINIETAEDLEKAFVTINVSPSFIANFNYNINSGIYPKTMFKHVARFFYFSDIALEDAKLFKKLFNFKGQKAGKLNQVVVRAVKVADESTFVTPYLSNPTDSSNGKEMLFTEEKFQMISQSQLVAYLTKKDVDGNLVRKYVEFTNTIDGLKTATKADDAIQKRSIEFMNELLYIDAAMDVAENEKDSAETKAKKAALRHKREVAIRNGIAVYTLNPDNTFKDVTAYGTTLRTGSQGRTQGAIAVRGAHNRDYAVKVLEAIGHPFSSYAKHGKGEHKDELMIDISKMISRPGLLGTTSRDIPVLNNICKDAEVIDLGKGYKELVNKDNDFKMLFSKDFEYTVTTGQYRVLVGIAAYKAMMENRKPTADELASQFKVLRADEQGVTLTIGDGQFFYGDVIHEIILAQFGKDNGVNQFRISPATKGLGVYYPGLEEATGYSAILPDSAVKVPYDTVDLKRNPIKFAIANFGKEQGHLKDSFKMNYQFMSAMVGVDKELFEDIVQNNFDLLSELLADPDKLHAHMGFDKLVDMMADSDDEDELEEMRDTLFNTFQKVFAANPKFHKDIWVKSQAYKSLEKAFKKYGKGEIHVEGNYRFMVQDPIALVKAHIRNINAVMGYTDDEVTFKLTKEDAIIETGHVYLPDNHSFDAIEKAIVALRAPLIDPAEAQKLIAKSYDEYNELRRRNSAFCSSVIVFGFLDFAAFAMGGADFDGDKCGVVLDERIVADYVPGAPVLDMTIVGINEDGSYEMEEGCVFQDTARQFPETTSPKLKREGWKVYFKEEDYEEVKGAIFDYLKEYILDTMEPSLVGYYTDKATKLLDAVHSLNVTIAELTESVKTLDDADKVNETVATIESMNKQVEDLLNKVALLRIVQGWEIDKSKHGGAFVNFLDLEFLDDAPEAVALKDINGNIVRDENGNKVWANLVWLQFQKGYSEMDILKTITNQEKKYKVTLNAQVDALYSNSALSHVTRKAVQLYHEAFDSENFTANLKDDNLLDVISGVKFSDQLIYSEVEAEVAPMMAEYNRKLKDIVSAGEVAKAQILTGEVIYVGSESNKMIEEIEVNVNAQITNLSEYATAQLEQYYTTRASVIDHLDLIIAKVVYEHTYNYRVNDYIANPDDYKESPARGTGYVWNVATEFMIALAEYLNGRKAVIKKSQEQFAKQYSMATTISFSPNNNLNADIINAVLAIKETHSVVEAVKYENEKGQLSYRLFIGQQYIGFAYMNQMTKLGNQPHVALLVDSAEQVEGHKAISLNISKAAAYTPSQERASFFRGELARLGF